MLLLACAMPPLDGSVEDAVHEIELNHYYDANGRIIFHQWVFWEWPACEPRRCVGWRMVDKEMRHSFSRSLHTGEWSLRFEDSDETLRHVRAKCYRETWTQYDPEVADREKWPIGRRRGLTKRSDPQQQWEPRGVKPQVDSP